MTQEPPAVPDDVNADGPSRAHPPEAVDSLKVAMRRARQDNAERAGVLDDMRIARLGRLELLQEALKPLVAQIPADADIFDMGLMPGATPRLFIDMIGFVEMGRDARMYCLLQDSRHGRVRIAESDDLDTMVDAVTDYVARRLLERDKALAADAQRRAASATPLVPSSRRSVRTPGSYTPEAVAAPRPRGPLKWFAVAFAFLIDLLGSIAFFTLIAVVGWYIWNRMHTPI